MKKILSIAAILLAVGFTANAAEFLAPDKNGDPNVSTLATEVIRNLYAAGATVSINSTSQGDLFAAGGVVTVNGNVEDDLFAAGGNVTLNGNVGGNLRTAGGNIAISSTIGQDLLAAGGNIIIASKATVGADLIVAGGNVVVDSEVRGKAKATGGNITINGKINGNLEVIAEEGLTFGPNSEVTGKVTYKGPKEAVVKEGAKIGTIQYTQTRGKNFGYKFAALLTFAMIIKLLALFAAAWLLNRLMPGKVQSLVDTSYARPMHNLGLGLLALIATPIVAILLMVSLVGFYIGAFLMVLFVLTLLLAGLVLPYFIGALLVSWYRKNSNMEVSWKTLVYGLLAGLIVSWIPLIGCLIVGVAFLIVLGSLVGKFRSHTAV